MENIILQYSSWYIALCLIIGFIYAFGLYFKQKNLQDKSRLLVLFLSFLRFIVVSGLSFLLLSPLFKYITEQKSKPIVVIAQDYSTSLHNTYSADELRQINKKIHQFKAKLYEKYNVQEFSLGSDLVQGLSDTFSLKSTNISKFIEYLNQSYDDTELSAIVLSSDGIYNEGKNPDYLNLEFNAPLYTIALGDTSIQKDALISEVYYNDIAFLDDQIGIKVDIQTKNYKGNKTRLSLYSVSDNGQLSLIDNRAIKINKDIYFQQEFFMVKANTPGNAHYRLSLARLDNEVSYKNNVKDFYIKIIDSRIKILLVANSPHPDLGAIKDVLTSNKNYELDIKYKSDSYKPEMYDLIMYYNLPSDNFSIDNIHKKALGMKIPEFYIYGSQTNQKEFNEVQDLLTIKGNSTSSNEVQSIVNKNFKLFLTDGFVNKGLQRFPPLLAPFGEYKVSPDSRILLYQKINKIDTKYPLLVTNTGAKNRVAVLLGENVFKWRLYNYLVDNNYDIVKSLFSQVIQYLTVKKDKSQWRVKARKNLYYDTDPIIFNAELYNDNFELINKPEAYLKIIDAKSKEYDFVFTRSENNYILNSGQFPVGHYRYIATVKYNGKTLTKKGKFDIQAKDLENFDLVARHRVLNNLSSRTNGKLYYENQMNALVDDLNKREVKPIIYYGQNTKKVIDFKWLFFLFLSLLSLEWFIRRYNGTF